MTIPVTVIRPSSRENPDRTAAGMAALQKWGFEANYLDPKADPEWGYTAGPATERWEKLKPPLLGDQRTIIWSARGGYGASDLLDHIPWSRKPAAPKMVVGFSDISALHSALWTKWQWPGLHAPMPATTLWPDNAGAQDLRETATMLGAWNEQSTYTASLDLVPVGHNSALSASGTLFGGCLSVLTNLIGTPYLPNDLRDYILFFEDTGENPGRLMRHLNQWRQAGLMEQVSAVIFGHLRDLGGQHVDCDPLVYNRLAQSLGRPCFQSPLFGHTSPNMPMLVGAPAEIKDSQLRWRWSPQQQPTGLVT